MSGRPTTILFDLDDTILDDTGSVQESWRQALLIDGVAPAGLADEVRRTAAWYWSDADRHRVGRADLLAATTGIVETALEHLGRPDPKLARRIATRYRELRERAIAPIPGAIETIERLRGEGVVLGLITNGDAAGQRRKLERFDLERLFDHIGIEGERGFGKPDPRAYTATVEALACDVATTWMVGDNLEWDVLAPQRQGIAGVWVNPSERAPHPGAEAPWRVVSSVAELV